MSREANAEGRPSGSQIACKILYLIDTLEVGGAERSLLEVVRRLDRRQFDPVVCHVYRGDRMRGEFEQAGVRVIALNLLGKYQFLRATRRVIQVIKAEQPDLVHTTLFRADQIGRIAVCWTRTPVVSSFVNTSYEPVRLVENPHLSPWKLATLRRLDAWTCRWVYRFHAVSASVRDSNCKHLNVSADRVDVIPRGRPIDEFANGSARDASRVRNDLLANRPGHLFLNVGRVIDQKGQRYLVEAMPRVLQALPHAQLVIVGDGWNRRALEQLAAARGVAERVSFLGWRNDVPRLLAAADVFVLPSLFEGLPGALVEAMLAGKPVVASDLPETREVIGDGECGILVPPRDPDRLADAMTRIGSDRQLAARLAEKAQRHARERFDIDHVVAAMERFYTSCIKNRRVPNEQLVVA